MRAILPLLTALVFLCGCPGPSVSDDLRRACELVDEGRYGEAKAALAPLVDAGADRPLVRYLLGVIALEGDGDRDEAMRQFEKALSLSPGFDLGKYFLLLAEQYARTGRLGRAVETYKSCMRLHTRGKLAYKAGLGLARLYERAGNYRGAAELYQTLAQRFRSQENTAGLELHLAEIYERRLGDLPRATATYERVAARYPGTPEASLAKSALVLMHKEHPEQFSACLVVVKHRVKRTDEGPRVVGVVKNTGRVAAGFAVVKVTLLDRSGGDLGTYKAYVKGLHVKPGEEAAFEVKIPAAKYSDYRISLGWEELGY